jgi:hypothetical protein
VDSQLVAILYAGGSSRLVLSTWRVDSTSISFVADSGQSMGAGDLARVIAAPTGHVVVVCRDGSDKLLLIPFDITREGAAVTRISGADGHAGVIREVAPIARPYGLLTAVISEGATCSSSNGAWMLTARSFGWARAAPRPGRAVSFPSLRSRSPTR